MKKQRSHKQKIFSCLALFLALVIVGGSSQAASRKLHFALANNYNSQCDPDYQSINQGIGAPANYNYAKTVKAKPQSKVSGQNLPSFGVVSTFYTSAANLQEPCIGYINQNYQTNLHSQFYEISEWKAPDSQVPLFKNSIAEEIQASESESVSDIPVPGAIWLFGSTLVGIYGLGKRKTFQV